MQIGPATDDELAAVITLWDRCGLTRPWNDIAEDIRFARAGPASDVLVGRDQGQVVGAVMVGHDGHRGAVYYLGTDPSRRGAGLGRAIMAAAEAWLRDRGVWKLNLQVRRGNEAAGGFYRALGYRDQETVTLGRRLDGRPDRHPGGAGPGDLPAAG